MDKYFEDKLATIIYDKLIIKYSEYYEDVDSEILMEAIYRTIQDLDLLCEKRSIQQIHKYIIENYI